MVKPAIPAAWLPQAAVKVTVVWTHPDYDSTVQVVSVARDWESRGESYIRREADLDDGTIILAVFSGVQNFTIGAAVKS